MPSKRELLEENDDLTQENEALREKLLEMRDTIDDLVGDDDDDDEGEEGEAE